MAVDGRGVLILGKSGAGKSSLALTLLAFGAGLVADDRVTLIDDAGPTAMPPPAIAGLIEARGVGLLRAPIVARCSVDLVIDLDIQEADRLPPIRYISILGHDVPLQHNADAPHFAPAIMQYLRAGRSH